MQRDDAAAQQFAMLEERLQPTQPFVVSNFARHAERVRYVPAPGDEELLRTAGELCFDISSSVDDEAGSSRSVHPLRSMREDLGVHNRPMRNWKRRDYKVAQPSRELMARAKGAKAGTAGTSGTSGAAAGSVVLRVALFHGSRKVREFEVHEGQTLFELREVLTCRTSAEIAFQQSQLAKRDPAALAVLPAPSDSAAMCIEDEWFVSGREDLSAEARAWARAHGGEGRSPREMGSVTFGELKLRLGMAYLFVHHGDCEHALVFTRCALLTADAAALSRSFPRLVWERHEAEKLCVVCFRERAEWDVHGDSLADVLPCYLCQTCHYQAHYTKEGVLRRNDYRIYPLLREKVDSPERRDDRTDETALVPAAASAAAAAPPEAAAPSCSCLAALPGPSTAPGVPADMEAMEAMQAVLQAGIPLAHGLPDAFAVDDGSALLAAAMGMAEAPEAEPEPEQRVSSKRKGKQKARADPPAASPQEGRRSPRKRTR